MMFREDSAANATCRPGRDQPPKKGDGSRPENRPPFDERALRARLLESGFHEVMDALGAGADEAFNALLAAIDRLAGKGGPGTPCQSCGTITSHGKLCSKSCQLNWDSCQPDERRSLRYRRRKASGALV